MDEILDIDQDDKSKEKDWMETIDEKVEDETERKEGQIKKKHISKVVKPVSKMSMSCKKDFKKPNQSSSGGGFGGKVSVSHCTV